MAPSSTQRRAVADPMPVPAAAVTTTVLPASRPCPGTYAAGRSRSSGLPREAEGSLADDVALHLVRSPVDRVGPAEEEHPRREPVVAGRRRPMTSTASSPMSRCRFAQNSFVIMAAGGVTGPADITRSALSRMSWRRIHRRDGALAHDRVRDAAVGAGALEHLLQLGRRRRGSARASTRRARRRACPSPPATRRRRAPTTWSAARAGAGEEHLVELAVAGDLHDRADLDAGLVHRHEQVRDALVLRRVPVGAGEDEAPLGPVGERCPDLLPVDDPLAGRFVEVRLGLHVGEVGAGVGLAVALAPQLGRRPRSPGGSGAAAPTVP